MPMKSQLGQAGLETRISDEDVSKRLKSSHEELKAGMHFIAARKFEGYHESYTQKYVETSFLSAWKTSYETIVAENQSAWRSLVKSCTTVQLILFILVSMRSEKPIYAPPATVLMFICLRMALPLPFKEDRLVLPLSTPLSSRRSMV